MKFVPLSSLRSRLILLIFLAMMPVVGVILYADFEERAFLISDMEEQVQRISQLTASVQEQIIEGTHQLLSSLAKLPELEDYNVAECKAHFAEVLNEHPQYVHIGAALPNGDLFAGSGTGLGGQSNVEDQEWFRRTIRTCQFTVASYKAEPVKGKGVLIFSYPVLNREGSVRAVLFVGLDLEQLNEFSTEIQLPDGAEYIMVDRDGTILAYSPDPEPWVGRTREQLPIIRTILTEKEGISEVRGLDGRKRLYALSPLRGVVDTGLYVSIGIPFSIAFAEVNKILLHNLTVLGIVGLISLLAIWFGSDMFLLRRVHALRAAAKRLAGGDMGSRTGLSYGMGELDELARSFDEMAEAIEQGSGKLRQTEAKYRSLVERIPAVTYAANLDDCRSTFYISPQVEGTLGFTSEEWLREPALWSQRLHPEDCSWVLESFGQSRTGRKPFIAEYRIFTKDGRLLWLSDEASIVRDELNNSEYFQGIMRDITVRKQSEEKIFEYQKQLRSLASQLTLVEERERRRIATELHDRVGQSLAICKIKLGQLQSEAQSSLDILPSIQETRTLLDQAIQDTRSLIFRISSPILYELGFEAAVEWLTEDIQKRHGIPVAFEDDGLPKPLDDDVRVLLFQATSELLINVVKHARAKSAKVSLRKEDAGIRIEVEDDGSGFNLSETDRLSVNSGGFGLFSIRERLNDVDGRMEVRSSPDSGSRVTMAAPLRDSP